MAQEIVTWCDLCMERDDSRTAGATYSISFNGQPPRDFDLCTPDRKSLLDPILELLDRLGAPAVKVKSAQSLSQTGLKRPRGPRIMTCLLCDHSFGSNSALHSHYRDQHGITRIGERIGLVCPVCGETQVLQKALVTHVAQGHIEETSLHMALRRRLENPALDTFGVAATVLANFMAND